MFGEEFPGAINRRCWEEAMSVQDMLSPASAQPTWHAVAQARLRMLAARLPRRPATGERRESGVDQREPEVVPAPTA